MRLRRRVLATCLFSALTLSILLVFGVLWRRSPVENTTGRASFEPRFRDRPVGPIGGNEDQHDTLSAHTEALDIERRPDQGQRETKVAQDNVDVRGVPEGTSEDPRRADEVERQPEGGEATHEAEKLLKRDEPRSDPRQEQPLVLLPPHISVPRPQFGHKGTVVLVICYNRPDYLRRMLSGLQSVLPREGGPSLIVVSQDGSLDPVTSVVAAFSASMAASQPDVLVEHMYHDQGGLRGNGYEKLAVHFGWALQRVFGLHRARRVIVLEDDLELAPDVFDYFGAAAPLLDSDETLMGASAFNDMGQALYVSDPRRLYRSDFFSGLGWMMPSRVWDELGPRWPRGYWDDWLREPQQRKGRAFIRPEVSRARTFGEFGVSTGQFFRKFHTTIRLCDVVVPWASVDLGYLEKSVYDAAFWHSVSKADAVSWSALTTLSCESSERSYKVFYESVDGMGPSDFPALATRLGVIGDAKAKVPRGAYGGVVKLRQRGCGLFLVPREQPQV